MYPHSCEYKSVVCEERNPKMTMPGERKFLFALRWGLQYLHTYVYGNVHLMNVLRIQRPDSLGGGLPASWYRTVAPARCNNLPVTPPLRVCHARCKCSGGSCNSDKEGLPGEVQASPSSSAAGFVVVGADVIPHGPVALMLGDVDLGVAQSHAFLVCT